MKRMKRILSVILIAAVILSVCACGKEAQQDESTRVITDVFGREVTIPAKIESAAALGSAARLIVYAGGLEYIKGCTEMEMKGNPGMPFAYANREYFKNCTALASGGSGERPLPDTRRATLFRLCGVWDGGGLMSNGDRPHYSLT